MVITGCLLPVGSPIREMSDEVNAAFSLADHSNTEPSSTETQQQSEQVEFEDSPPSEVKGNAQRYVPNMLPRIFVPSVAPFLIGDSNACSHNAQDFPDAGSHRDSSTEVLGSLIMELVAKHPTAWWSTAKADAHPMPLLRRILRLRGWPKVLVVPESTEEVDAEVTEDTDEEDPAAAMGLLEEGLGAGLGRDSNFGTRPRFQQSLFMETLQVEVGWRLYSLVQMSSRVKIWKWVCCL